MKFIHFIDSDSSEKVLREGISLNPNHRKVNQASTGIFCYPLIKIPFKAPVNEEDFDDGSDYLAFQREEHILNESLSIEESWEVVGTSRVTRRDPEVKNVSGVIFDLNENHWPLTVFMNVRHSIGKKFAQILERNSNEGILFRGYKNSLLTLVGSIQSERYVIASASFTVNSENDLLDFVDKLTLAGGGIWKGDSFECMLTEKLDGENIEQITELKNSYYHSLEE
ncbi:MAG: hypothetical protein AAF206_24860 [Bacteroidota bacterium]